MIVTSLFIQRNGTLTKPVEKYFDDFSYLANTGIQICLFLDKRIEVNGLPPNVNVMKADISDLHTFKIMNVNEPIVHTFDNPAKNTLDYHIIQNAKTELMCSVSDHFGCERVTWVDFGISHILKNKDSINKLKLLDKLQTGVIVPGCYNYKTNFISPISWRFCGGLISSDKDSVNGLLNIQQHALRSILPHITWEVNVWAIMESVYQFPFKWYEADHNETIFNFDRYLLDQTQSEI
jgi:hypothetical protein